MIGSPKVFIRLAADHTCVVDHDEVFVHLVTRTPSASKVIQAVEIRVEQGSRVEPVAVGLARADLVLSIGDEAAQARFAAGWGAQLAIPQFRGQLRPLAMGMDWAGARVLAFAGIADPERFFATLRSQGAEVLRGEALTDHATLSETLLRRLEAEASAVGAQLVTTEKDAARLPEDWRAKVLTLVVRLEVEDCGPLDQACHKLAL